MTLRESLHHRFMNKLLATAEGRGHVLGLLADAESRGEAEVFDRTLSKVDDPQLQKMIEKHRADEIRHAKMFRACQARIGAPVPPPPRELDVLADLDEALGGVMSRPITDGSGVMEAYALLQVIEERALAQFPLLEHAFRKIDPETADTFVQIARDEQRHLRYCVAIARRYAPDEQTRLETVARFRRVEAEVFRAHQRQNQRYVFANGWFKAGRLEKLLWQMVGTLQPTVEAVEVIAPMQAELAAA
jgi:rubrerythrin